MADFSTHTLYRRKSLCDITSGKRDSLPKITHIAFGSGGVDAQGDPVEPSEEQTALIAEVAKYPLDSTTYPIPTTARYTTTIPKYDLSGTRISEAGLIDEEGNLCAVKNFLSKGKDDGVSFTFTFDDEF